MTAKEFKQKLVDKLEEQRVKEPGSMLDPMLEEFAPYQCQLIQTWIAAMFEDEKLTPT